MVVGNGYNYLVTNTSCIEFGTGYVDLMKSDCNICIGRIIDFLNLYSDCVISIDSKPIRYSFADSFVLLVIGMYRQTINCAEDRKIYEITFSYNFPIILEKNLVNLFFDNLTILSEAQLISLGENRDFIRTDVSNEHQYEIFYKRMGELIRKNDRNLKVVDNYPLFEVLNRWKNYCKKKFDVEYSAERIEAYKIVYAYPGFSTETIIYENEIVAQGVIYVSEYSKTLYYCIFAWDEKYAKLSPGKYAYSKAIQKCHRLGYKFSFCYGLQEYKLELLKDFMNKR